MNNRQVPKAFSELSTPLVADACFRVEVPLQVAPWQLRPLHLEYRSAGQVLPVKHLGSVDAFFEALATARPGDVMVVDNQGRPDEGCVGDLVTIEVQAAGLSAILIWGAHRDTKEILATRFPVFSCGSCPLGPQPSRLRESRSSEEVFVGEAAVTRDDYAFADADGVLFLGAENLDEVLRVAAELRDIEREQAQRLSRGITLRKQLQFTEYLERREQDSSYTFREHLRRIGGAIEE